MRFVEKNDMGCVDCTWELRADGSVWVLDAYHEIYRPIEDSQEMHKFHVALYDAIEAGTLAPPDLGKCFVNAVLDSVDFMTALERTANQLATNISSDIRGIVQAEIIANSTLMLAVKKKP